MGQRSGVACPERQALKRKRRHKHTTKSPSRPKATLTTNTDAQVDAALKQTIISNVGKASEHKAPSRPIEDNNSQNPTNTNLRILAGCVCMCIYLYIYIYVCIYIYASKMGKIGEHETPRRQTLMRPVRSFPPIVRLQQHAMRLKPVTVALMHPKPSLPQHRNHRRNPFAGINARRAVHCECKMLRSSLLSSVASVMSSDTFRANTPASMHTTKTQEYTYLYSSSSMSSFVIAIDHLARNQPY